jgi:hypothetical protein
MKKFIFNHHKLQLLIVLMTLACFTACKKENTYSSNDAPVITRIRSINAAPNDSTLTKVLPGQLVVIQGDNLLGATAVYFNGVSATFNAALVAKTNLVVTVPEPDFSKPVAGQENTIRVVTNAGETSFNLPLVPPPPMITGVDYEYRAAGQVLTIYGQYLYMVSKVAFTGGDGTNIVSNATGTSLQVTIPAAATTGKIVLSTKGGSVSYASYNDRVTGMFSNFDDINKFQYWSASQTNDATLFPGGTGSYVQMKFDNVGINDLAWYDGGRSINMNDGVWVPAANLSDPATDWALKFDIYVKEAWKTGALLVRTDSYTYMARYEPWKTAPGGSFTTTGWTTVTLPLSNFKKEAAGFQGTGEAIPNLSTLLGTNGTKAMSFMFYNDSSTPIAKFDAGIDNIRIVKIR